MTPRRNRGAIDVERLLVIVILVVVLILVLNRI